MDDARPPDRRSTPALAALGLLDAGAEASLAVWRSWPLAPARYLAAPVVDGLAGRGERRRLELESEVAGVTEQAVAVAVDHALVERVVAELLRAGVIERVADQLVESSLPARLVDEVGAHQRALVDDVLGRVLESAELQRVVEHVASSDAIRRALSAQSSGLADEVAGAVRSRSENADEAAERFARRLLHRRARPGPLGPEPG